VSGAAHILIVGCGAIGGLFAAALSSVAKVTAFDANSERVRTIKAQGLRVTGKNPPTHAGSMALDNVRGASTEIDELTGFVVHEGERLKVSGALQSRVSACEGA
jgi:2-dehydropantoate 2-reductase